MLCCSWRCLWTEMQTWWWINGTDITNSEYGCPMVQHFVDKRNVHIHNFSHSSCEVETCISNHTCGVIRDVNTHTCPSKFQRRFSYSTVHGWVPTSRWPLTPAWISNNIHYNVWNEITYPFPNFKCATVEVWKWMSKFITHFTVHVITYPCCDQVNPC